jgi:cytochrome c-type biogenesis protein CcmH
MSVVLGRKRWAVAVALMVALASPVGAVDPGEVLADPALEARAREVSKELRCLVCQNQSIDDSDAELARDLRLLVRERVAAGDSNDQVVDYVVSRYGDFVLLKPPFKASTYLLWLGPAVILVTGLAAVVLYHRRKVKAGAAGDGPGLSDDEQARLARLLDDEPR